MANAVARGGEVKLTTDITISTTLLVSGAVALDLDGHVLKYENDQALGSVIKVCESGNLTIKDSNPAIVHKFTPNSNGLWVLDEANGTEEVKGGIITGGTGTSTSPYSNSGGGVHVSSSGTLTMNGGSIVGCSAKYGGGVYLQNGSDAQTTCSFIMGSIVGCVSSSYGGGVEIESRSEFIMNRGAAINRCKAGSGGGVYVNTASNEPGKFTLNGGEIRLCEAEGSSGYGRGGGIYNEGTFAMTSGAIENCVASDRPSGGVWNSGTFTMGGGVIGNPDSSSSDVSDIYNIADRAANFTICGDAKIYAKVTNKHTLYADGGEIYGTVTNTNYGTIAGSNSTSTAFTGEVINDGRIERGMFTGSVINKGTITSGTFTGSVTVAGSMAVGANCEVIIEGEDASLDIVESGTVAIVAAEGVGKPGLLSLGAGIVLTVDGKLTNEGILSVSDMENLKKVADVGGDLCLNRMTVTEDYTLDMKGHLLIISDLLNFEPDSNLTVKNASKVDARGIVISGGDYHCPVFAGDENGEIVAGNFYEPVEIRYQGSSENTVLVPISGGTFYGAVTGAAYITGGVFHESVTLTGSPQSTHVSGGTFYGGLPVDSGGKQVPLRGRIVTFVNDGSNYAMQVVGDGGAASAPDAPSKNGYTFAGWYTEDGKKFDFKNASVTADITLTARWASSGSDWSPRYAVAVADEPSHGSVTVSAKYAYRGATVTVTTTPDAGYTLETLTATDARGNELVLTDKGDGVFTFIMPGSEVEVKATFMEDNSLLNIFYDVPNDAYFYEAVKWAAASGIVQGYGNGFFGPDDACTRAQIVTFLWRAAGSPEPSALCEFSDVSQDAYYAKAVAWAAETDIAQGYGNGLFGPDDVCTRGQVATFLWRAAGSPEPASQGGFADIAEDAYYSAAVAWAAEKGIACGYGNGAFGPNDGCTRGQAVTFLWRANS